jgi:hypothetical protein
MRAQGGEKMISRHLLQFKKTVTIVFVVLFSFFGIQSSYADYYPTGIQQNVSEQTLRDNGWTLSYEQTYGTPIGQSTAPIRPTGQYVILAGKAVGSSNILLAAAAPTAQVFTETVLNTPQLLNGAYWYLTLDTGDGQGSIGFAPTNSINQDSADYGNWTDPLRLSWHLIADTGGYRLGDINRDTNGFNTGIDLNGGEGGAAYLKQVWTWNGESVKAKKRANTNLTFKESLYASDTLSDPDGQLRKTVDLINAKYGNLIK